MNWMSHALDFMSCNKRKLSTQSTKHSATYV